MILYGRLLSVLTAKFLPAAAKTRRCAFGMLIRVSASRSYKDILTGYGLFLLVPIVPPLPAAVMTEQLKYGMCIPVDASRPCKDTLPGLGLLHLALMGTS